MMRLAAYWYINGIPIYRPADDQLEPDWDNDAISEEVHYKGSDDGAVHVNGFTLESLTGVDVRVHENDHQTLRVLRLQSVVIVGVKSNDERTAVLRAYNARREGGTCYFRGTMTLTEV